MTTQEYTSDAQPQIGDRILVRFNFCDEQGNVVEEQQFKGTIDSITEEEVVLTHPENGKKVTLPPHFGSYIRPEAGTYQLPSTGETMMNPDYITEWTLRNK